MADKNPYAAACWSLLERNPETLLVLLFVLATVLLDCAASVLGVLGLWSVVSVFDSAWAVQRTERCSSLAAALRGAVTLELMHANLLQWLASAMLSGDSNSKQTPSSKRPTHSTTVLVQHTADRRGVQHCCPSSD